MMAPIFCVLGKTELSVKDNAQVLSSIINIWDERTEQWLDLMLELLWADDELLSSI